MGEGGVCVYIMASLLFLPVGLLTSPPSPSPLPQTRTVSSSTWKIQEDWALIDEAEAHTIGEGEHTVTFWDGIREVPALRHRSSDELHERAVALSLHHGKNPSLLL